MSGPAPIITHTEAEGVGEALRTHWASLTGQPVNVPPMQWADVVQFVLRRANEAIEGRGE